MVRPSAMLSLGAAVLIGSCTNNVAAVKVVHSMLKMTKIGTVDAEMAPGSSNIVEVESITYKPKSKLFLATSKSGLSIYKFISLGHYEVTIKDFEDFYPTYVAYSAVHDQLAITLAPREDPLKLGKLYVFPSVAKWEICEFCDNHFYVLPTGYHPKMVTFTPDGQRILVANEGVPLDYSCKHNDPEGSVSIYKKKHSHHSHIVHHRNEQYEACTADFRRFDEPWHTDAMKRRGVRVTGVGFTKFSQDMEPEHIAVSHDSKTAYVTLQENNAIAKIDINKCEVEDVFPLGYKEWGRDGLVFDASNNDDISLQEWPMVKGMYMPDNVVTFKAKGETFLVVANEGKTRTIGKSGTLQFYTDKLRVSSLADRLLIREGANTNARATPSPFGDLNEFGRLQVSRTLPFTGNFNELYAFGARSISIFTSKGKRVWDSEDFIEKYIKDNDPDNFNVGKASQGTSPPRTDARSNLRGPEPSGLAIAEIQGRTFVFVGLKAVGGWMCWDVSDPHHPIFQSYINPSAGQTNVDLSPHSALVISADDSQNGQNPVLVVSNKKTGTIGLFTITLGY